MDRLLDELVKAIGQACGRDISCHDEKFLAKALAKRLAERDNESTTTYLVRLARDHVEAEAFCRSLIVTWSEFFRNPLTCALLEKIVLPGLIQHQQRTGRPAIRIWSAGCAAGEEAYSIAILLDELAETLGRPITYHIFATDILEAGLEAGRQGIYRPEALQNVRLRHWHHYFEPYGDSSRVCARLRSQVDFSHHDLLSPDRPCPAASIYGDFDLILCCNVLLYYRADVQRAIVGRLRTCLAPAGYLVTDEAERAILERDGSFTPVMPSAVIFQHTSSRER